VVNLQGTIQLTDGQDSKNSVVSLPPQFPSGGGTTGRGHFGEGRLRVKGSSSATARSCPTATDQISPESQDKDRKKKDNHNKSMFQHLPTLFFRCKLLKIYWLTFIS